MKTPSPVGTEAMPNQISPFRDDSLFKAAAHSAEHNRKFLQSYPMAAKYEPGIGDPYSISRRKEVSCSEEDTQGSQNGHLWARGGESVPSRHCRSSLVALHSLRAEASGETSLPAPRPQASSLQAASKAVSVATLCGLWHYVVASQQANPGTQSFWGTHYRPAPHINMKQ